MNNIHVNWVFFSNNERFQAVMKACIALVVTILQHFLEYTKFFAKKSINLKKIHSFDRFYYKIKLVSG